nr:MAG: hypothetical protein [Microvirus sp.]
MARYRGKKRKGRRVTYRKPKRARLGGRIGLRM